MTEPSKRPSLAHRVEYALYRWMEGVLGQIPLDVVTIAGEVLAGGVRMVSSKHRKLVMRNLRIATAADKPTAEDHERLMRDTFRRAGRNLLGSLRSALMEPEELGPYLRVEGAHHLADRAAAGLGTVLSWSHMGNWEMLAQAHSYLGNYTSGGPIYRPLENPLLDALTVDRRTAQGASVFSKHDGFNGPAKTIREGGLVTVMSDQRAGGHGELCPFFGRLSSCTPLPSLLARRAKSRIVTLSISSSNDGTWVMRLRSLPDKVDTTELMAHLETAMRDSITDVFWFHDRWRVDRTRPLSFYTKQSPTEPSKEASVPTRLVATLPANAPESVAALERILEIRPDARIDVLDDGHLPSLPDDDRIQRVWWDPHCPPEHLPGVLQRSDGNHPAPLDFALVLDGHRDLAKAARRFGLRSVIGCGGNGKPFTRSFPRPTDAEGWRELADALAATPSSGAS
ncbi:hypothetical protein KBB96_19335 [Luteolibacter ambystomatis]|uniref:Lipid A biosynthesis acyltransferase n=1 Tax=Luteolibacter ambystomatis TaxID=2824561 RepID=A0A975G917_9BACT|nr:hypothetical protein [Luteolibacter ambystomatis]QUE50996.1 hypothetical protein KBB96_19335 [Luteolibacter ambystomatis]